MSALPDSGSSWRWTAIRLHLLRIIFPLALPISLRPHQVQASQQPSRRGHFLRSLTPGRYAASMREMVTMANSTAGLNPRCVAAHGEDCIFAEVSARFLRTPAFALQSAFDTWQVMNEMATGKNTSRASVNAYGARLRSALHATLLASLDVRHGAFIDSCSHHCFKWGDIRIRGAVQAAAHAQWYDEVVARGRAPRDDDDDDRVWEQGDGYPCDACCHGGRCGGACSFRIDRYDQLRLCDLCVTLEQ